MKFVNSIYVMSWNLFFFFNGSDGQCYCFFRNDHETIFWNQNKHLNSLNQFRRKFGLINWHLRSLRIEGDFVRICIARSHNSFAHGWVRSIEKHLICVVRLYSPSGLLCENKREKKEWMKRPIRMEIVSFFNKMCS